MAEILEQFETILNEQNAILDNLIEKQSVMRSAVTEKNWENLTKVIAEINSISEVFVQKDQKREELQDSLKIEELKPYFETLRELRTKLLKYKIENQALSKYVNITRDFIKGVVENALPQSGAKVYSKSGKIVQRQPQSVVLNQLF